MSICPWLQVHPVPILQFVLIKADGYEQGNHMSLMIPCATKFIALSFTVYGMLALLPFDRGKMVSNLSPLCPIQSHCRSHQGLIKQEKYIFTKQNEYHSEKLATEKSIEYSNWMIIYQHHHTYFVFVICHLRTSLLLSYRMIRFDLFFLCYINKSVFVELQN